MVGWGRRVDAVLRPLAVFLTSIKESNEMSDDLNATPPDEPGTPPTSDGEPAQDTSFMPRPQTSSASARSFDGLGEVTIDTTEIKSPLLRKAIEQIRGK